MPIFLLSIGLFVGSLMAVFEYWQYDEVMHDVAQLMTADVPASEVDRQIQQAIADDNPEDARMYLGIAERFGYAVDVAAYEPQIAELETTWRTISREVSRFAEGFMDGEAESASGVAGAMAADFTVVGDVRDLNEQYTRYDQGEDVNELVVTLAGVGVGLTAATVVSLGTTAPVKSGVSALKMASRGGKLTPQMQKMLLKQGQDVFDHKAFLAASRSESGFDGLRKAAADAYNPKAAEALSQTAAQVNSIRKSTSLLDSIQLLKYVENADDLRRLEKVSSTYGAQTKGIMKLAGKAVIGTTRVLRHAVELLVAIAATLVSFFASILSLGFMLRN